MEGWKMKGKLITIGVGVAAAAVGIRLLLSESAVADGKDAVGEPKVSESKPSTPSRNRRIASVKPAAKGVKRTLLSEKVIGALPPRLVAPGDIATFNVAVDAGESVEAASKKCFPEGVDTDGILAALKLMSVAKDAKMRRGAYKAVARLFTDADDLASAVMTAKALLASMPTVADDGRQEIDLGDGETEPEDEGGETVSEKSSDATPDAEVVDDSEATDGGQLSEELATGEVEMSATAEVEPMCDAVQGEAIEQLLKAGVADADAEVRREAVEAASQMEDHFRYDAYEAALKGSDSALKQDVLERCSTFSREEDVAIQRAALQDADPEVAATAQKYLNSDTAKSFLKADAEAKAAEPADGNN